MKKLLMMAATLLVLVIPARADQLPAIYLGQWCADGDVYYAVTPENTCHVANILTIKQKDMIWGVETGCRFRSVKKIQPTPPVVKIFAGEIRC